MNRPPALAVFSCGLLFSVMMISGSALAAPESSLEDVLKKMDDAAAKFRSAQADFAWTQYNKVIEDVSETQQGKIYFRRSAKEIQMAADIMKPETKLLIFSDGKIQIFQPHMEQIDVYDAGSHREEFESFLVLGFGGGGHDMVKSFEVKYQGSEKIDSLDTEKLDLTPKSDKVRQQFAHILLWIDPARGISVQQQLFQASGDYRLAKYSNIELNEKVPDGTFKLKASGKTKIINH